jgi:hypothetical protein
VAVVVGLLVIAFALSTLVSERTEAASGGDATTAPPSVDTPEYAGPGDSALNRPTGTPGDASPAGGNPSFPGAGVLDLKGLDGKGGIVGLPKQKIVLSMTSAAPIAYVGYIVPTSLDNSTGTVTSPGTSWSLTTIGYGPPDYAQLFSLAGPAGVPVTCTITVNGKVTETRTTSGPYDQLFCQG